MRVHNVFPGITKQEQDHFPPQIPDSLFSVSLGMFLKVESNL